MAKLLLSQNPNIPINQDLPKGNYTFCYQTTKVIHIIGHIWYPKEINKNNSITSTPDIEVQSVTSTEKDFKRYFVFHNKTFNIKDTVYTRTYLNQVTEKGIALGLYGWRDSSIVDDRSNIDYEIDILIYPRFTILISRNKNPMEEPRTWVLYLVLKDYKYTPLGKVQKNRR